MDIKHIIIWGHKLHSHTHSYIHNAFFIAFAKLGYETHWFDDNDDISNFYFIHSKYLLLYKEVIHSIGNFLPNKDLLFNKYNSSSSVILL